MLLDIMESKDTSSIIHTSLPVESSCCRDVKHPCQAQTFNRSHAQSQELGESRETWIIPKTVQRREYMNNAGTALRGCSLRTTTNSQNFLPQKHKIHRYLICLGIFTSILSN